MESVEDIPADSILDGLPWDWETYGEYLDDARADPEGINVGGHGRPLRGASVGDGRARARRRTRDRRRRHRDGRDRRRGDRARRARLLDQPHPAPPGARRSPRPGHVGRARPSCSRSARCSAGTASGTFEVAPRLGERDGADSLEGTRAEVAWMAEVNRRTGRPVTFGLAQQLRPARPLRAGPRVRRRGGGRRGVLRPQTTARGIGLLFGIAPPHPLRRAARRGALRELPLEGRLAALDDEATRSRLVADADARSDRGSTSPSCSCSAPTATPTTTTPPPTASRPTPRRRRDPRGDVRAAVAREPGPGPLQLPVPQPDDRGSRRDAAPPGDHARARRRRAARREIMDARPPTFFLAHWVRDRGVFTLEDGVRRLTSDTAARVRDPRSRRAAARAPSPTSTCSTSTSCACPMPEYVHDFPGGAGRFLQRGRGYDATIVNGQVFMHGARPPVSWLGPCYGAVPRAADHRGGDARLVRVRDVPADRRRPRRLPRRLHRPRARGAAAPG